jgi:predicted transcriptional regulator
MVRTLEANGYVSHKAYGNSYQYYPIVSREDYAGSSFKGIVSSYFNNSYLNAVSALVKEEKISLDDLKDLINQIENGSL